MVAYTYGVPAAQTRVERIKILIDDTLGLSEQVKLEGGVKEQLNLYNLDKQITGLAQDIERLFLGVY